MSLPTFKKSIEDSIVAYSRVIQNAESHESLVEHLIRLQNCIKEHTLHVQKEYCAMMRPKLERCKPQNETTIWATPGTVSMDRRALFRATSYDFSEPLSDRSIRSAARKGRYGAEAQRVATESASTREKRDDARRQRDLVQDILKEYMK